MSVFAVGVCMSVTVHVCLCVCVFIFKLCTHPGYEDPSVQYSFNVFEPTGALQTPQEVRHGRRAHLTHCMEKDRGGLQTHMHTQKTDRHTHTLLTVDDFLLAAPHHMNVFNADELQLDVGVVVLVLVAFTCCSIGHSVQLHTQIQNEWILLLVV